MQLLEVLIQEAPDGLVDAKTDLVARGKGWSDKLDRALKKCQKAYPDVVAYLHSLDG